jgi:uncharacterized membrane protein
MNNKNTNIILLAIIIVSCAVGAFYYPQLPERIISHWNASGEANGYMEKFWGVFIFPVIMLFMFLLYIIIPLIDPLKANTKSFRKYYNIFWIILELFFLYFYGLTLVWNLGYRFNFNIAIIPAISFLFFCVGSLFKNLKRNWFIGIRTPWTLSSDKVWDKTHRLGGKLFQAAAIISLLGLFMKGVAMVLVIVLPILTASIIAVVYSYVIYKKINY